MVGNCFRWADYNNNFNTTILDMIRFVIHTEFDLESLKTREENPLKFHLIPVRNMIENTYLILCEREVADLILAEVLEHEIIGSWNDKGDFYDDYVDSPDKEDKKEKKAKDKFTKDKYKKYLKQILKFEDENDTVGTLVDAPEDKLIVNISGWNRIKIDVDE